MAKVCPSDCHPRRTRYYGSNLYGGYMDEVDCDPEECSNAYEESEEEMTLANCPFCGGEAKIESTHPMLNTGMADTLYAIFCNKCSMGTNRHYPDTFLINAWNRRVLPKEVKALVEVGYRAATVCRMVSVEFSQELLQAIVAVEKLENGE